MFGGKWNILLTIKIEFLFDDPVGFASDLAENDLIENRIVYVSDSFG
jgi:hypothetical protein